MNTDDDNDDDKYIHGYANDHDNGYNNDGDKDDDYEDDKDNYGHANDDDKRDNDGKAYGLRRR